MKKIGMLIAIALSAMSRPVYAQDNNYRPINPALPFLLVAADARASGMADMGVATSPDAFSQQWNPAKYVFSEKQYGVGVSYTPYLRELVNDIGLLNLNFYKRVNERSAFAFSLRYYGLGGFEFRQTAVDQAREVKPNEIALDGSYSLKLSEQFSMAVAGRYLRSDLRLTEVEGATDAKAANSFAVDIAGYYQSPEIAYADFNGRWRGGFNISNVGPKISYSNDDTQEEFLPANLKLGGAFDFIFDADNRLMTAVEFNKLLVPTPSDSNGDGVVNTEDAYYNKGFVSGIFNSFGDAPGGFSEELKEVTWALGLEYMYQEAFALRTGYFNESNDKGAKKFFSLGAGFRYNATTIDISYLFSTSRVENPLENTLRFSLRFNFGDDFKEF
ncbi:type IX secretion system outer membrane channel protein PorV [Sinomicrobium weinanense]|uniref:Type IX secretion system outer membrane channel protein PorV n=1 Tax=Sinomicrobium weinanense TaxID=2842200 RepID=A0A926Q469_9FLAO|nr:type IX secretion system outer membrane channel protein PorV [Sinomicrobium weinanense]MBC9798292.1 type IX secretion system outer membrane channel protein PorV [Sinomicrobium weinanense]MBU3124535.1 type IX secretion system outer membrane channel protein PorV [Sinomicrobium weinanense]